MNETTKAVLKDIAYTHILRTMTGYADDDELKDIGLDFDIDRKYL